ncbi:probable acetyltransferase [Thermobifida fusca YX]|uniref:Probable acetyltransferase n=1 Tax=Thermobifida fusca (strain YX) TaxID=269800 RepID=Q47RS8_THEFY|nr:MULTISPECIES: GNAT family N-acetyltransferase [Thermobifida]AAZ54839.1 probable acetyltransferase [Thermobifida fusca YX]MBO2529305.1 N-acetyltransferase [Thermobifida sp.]MDD6791359.1 GNAT family N-acetyltransferase [Thermobifida fusca]PPS96565.1 acetyltransferase [Thermobifida fusca]PZN64889.1 MAG: GNAT family N-acetyltransferase [Thermobifida fusca]
MDHTIRPMTAADRPRLVEVSRAADTLFARAGVHLPDDDPDDLFDQAAAVLVAGRPPVGFAALTVLDGAAHLEQLSVHPDYGRRGIGTALLTAACAYAQEHGSPWITLTTFRDLPWNAPWYARHGFTVLPEPEWGPQLARQWREEIAAGIAVLPRVVMRRRLTPDRTTATGR